MPESSRLVEYENKGIREIRELKFEVSGEPVVKERPRVVKGHAYTPEKTKDQETRIALAYRRAYRTFMFGKEVPIRLVVGFYHGIPKSAKAKVRNQMIAEEIRPTKKKGDLDNLTKLVSDALNGVAYYDDSQIVEILARKFYSEKPRTEVYIAEVVEGDGW